LNLLGAETFSLDPDFLALNYLRRNIDPVLAGCLEAGIPYGVVETEGGLYGNLDNYLSTWPTDRAILDAVQVMCAWGRRTRDYLADAGALRGDQMAVTGVPRFDFYHPDWQPLLRAGDGATDRMVLISTKVAVANPQHHSVDAEVALYVDKLGFPRAKVLEMLEVGRLNIAATTALAAAAARAHPDLRFVVRPHPHERLQTYEDSLSGIAPNLSVVRTGTVDGWLVRSSALVHRQCTTAIEAGLAGVPALGAQWVPSTTDAPDTDLVSLRCETQEELDAALDAVAKGELRVAPEVQRELDRIVDEWLHAVDGRSHERVAAALLAVAGPRPTRSQAVARRRFYRSHTSVRSLPGAAGRVARALAGAGATGAAATVAHPAARRWATTAKAYSAAEVADLIGAIHRLVGSGAPPAVAAVRDTDLYRYGYQGHAVVIS
jgi:surface carbohydrate biosynthesis protein